MPASTWSCDGHRRGDYRYSRQTLLGHSVHNEGTCWMKGDDKSLRELRLPATLRRSRRFWLQMRMQLTGAWLSRLLLHANVGNISQSFALIRQAVPVPSSRHSDDGHGLFRWLNCMIGLRNASLQYQKLAHDKGSHAVTMRLPTELASWRPELATVHFRQSSSGTQSTIGLASILEGAVSAAAIGSFARPVNLHGVHASASKAPCKLTIGCCGSSARLDAST